MVGNKSYNELIERLVDYRGVLMTENTDGATTGTESTPASSPDSVTEEEPPADHPATFTDAQAGGTAVATGLNRLTIDVNAEASNGSSPASTPKKSPSQKTVQTLVTERHLSDADAVDKATTLLEEGPVLEEFFNGTASQLTYYGLVQLHEEVRERQLCVFFRNNHFSTLFKVRHAFKMADTMVKLTAHVLVCVGSTKAHSTCSQLTLATWTSPTSFGSA